MSETTASQASQQKPAAKPVKPVEPAPQPAAKVTTPTVNALSSTTAAASVPMAPAGKVKVQKAQQPAGAYEPPTAEYLRAPDGPVVLPVSRYQKVLKIRLHIHVLVVLHLRPYQLNILFLGPDQPYFSR